MGYGIKFMVWGERACFTRPEMKVERVSYDVITPAAARGILEAVYWKPAIRWVIDEIVVQNEIRWENLRRNELRGTVPMGKVESIYYGNSQDYLQQPQGAETIAQRATLLLKDVCYTVTAHFEMTERATAEDTIEKHYNIALRRLRKGQCYHHPYLGCREFGADFRLVEDGEQLPPSFYQGQERDLGFMLWDLDFSSPREIQPHFFRALMRDGVLDLRQLLRQGGLK